MNPEDDEVIQEESQYFDLSQLTPVEHKHEKIVGNELRCVIHNDTCPVILIKPTEVLERNDKGELELVDKAPR